MEQILNELVPAPALRARLYEKLRAAGEPNVRPTWNEKWLLEVDAMPEGPEKEAQLDKAVRTLLYAITDLEVNADWYERDAKQLNQAFEDWMNQGERPTNGDLVEYEKIDKEILRHLARFIWNRARQQ